MTISNQSLYPRQPQAGFTLVEIMVGLAIGMLATVVIMQVLSVFEAQKRTTTGSADAQTSGSIALYDIGRDIQGAGYPLMSTANTPLNCATLTFGSTGISDVFPVSITNGNSDTITIRYGSSPMGGIPTSITAAPIGNDAPVDNNFGCQVGDITLIINGTTCALSSASAVVGTTTVTLKDTTGVVAGANLSCLGTWHEITYRVNAGNLERQDRAISNDFVPIVPGIVNIQAQYGISATANSNPITNWVDASGATWTAPTVADRNRIKAVRIAVVARNDKREGAAVTSTCTTFKGTTNNGPCAWNDSTVDAAPGINLSNDADGTSWQRYRYRVFETIIPLRNVIWSRSVL